jgi:hypothetical protein
MKPIHFLPYLSLVSYFSFFLLIDFANTTFIKVVFSLVLTIIFSSDFLYRAVVQKDFRNNRTRAFLFLFGFLSLCFYWSREYLNVPPKPGVSEQATLLPQIRDLLLMFTVIGSLLYSIGTIIIELSTLSVKAQSQLRTEKTNLIQNFLFHLLIIIPLVIGVNYIAVQRNYNFDMSASGKYSLSPTSQHIIKNVNKQITITGFYPRPLESSQSANSNQVYMLSYIRSEIEVLCDQIRTKNPNIQVKFINADVETEQLGSYLQVSNGMVVVRRLKDTFGSGEYPYIEQTIIAGSKTDLEDIERKIVRAIIAVSSPEKNLYYPVSNGERYGIAFQNLYQQQVTKLVEALSFMNLKPKTLGYDQKWPQEVPENADAVAIIGANTSFSEEAKQSMVNYVENRKGKVFIAVDPYGSEHFNWLLEKAGLNYNPTILSETEHKHGVTVVKSFVNHPISNALASKGNGLQYPFTGFFEKKTDVASVSYKYEILLESNYSSYEDTNKNGVMDGQETKLIRILGIVMSPKKNNEDKEPIRPSKDSGLIILYSATSWLTNTSIHPSMMNITGFVNMPFAVNNFMWMTGDVTIDGIPAKKEDMQPVYLTDKQKNIVWILGLIVYPAMIVLLSGVYVFMRRKE